MLYVCAAASESVVTRKKYQLSHTYELSQRTKNTMREKENIQTSVDIVFPSVLYLV